MQTIAIPTFVNEPLSDFSDPNARVWENINEAIVSVRRELLGRKYPVITGGHTVHTERVLRIINPSKKSEVLGFVSVTSPHDIEDGMYTTRVSGVLNKWSTTSFIERAVYLKRVADMFRKNRFFFIALMMLEVGKSAPEADAEVSEAIDFLGWYALYAPFIEELCNKTLLNPAGEKNSASYMPIGTLPMCASIQPWNFPVAISVGPAAAALVSGYAVLYKPAEQSSIIGYHVARMFYDAGIPKELFHFIPGYGNEVGSYLVNHPSVNAVAFTGSKEVRQKIQSAIAHYNSVEIMNLSPEDRYEKRALALESGGKNVIIVDSDADLDEAIVGASDSAFGFQGQKCSACSRLIIVDKKGEEGERYRTIMDRLSDRVRSLSIGSPEDPKNRVGPLIDESAVKKFNSYLDIAIRDGGRVRAEAAMPESSFSGYFVPPTVIDRVPLNSSLAHEEVFGPLLSVFCVSTFQEAVSLANDTEFALTAGIYSRNPKNIELFKEKLRAGNIYINRKITGALVGRQPFGGFKMSGNSTKAGGWDYLLTFLLDKKNISENTMRRGIPVA